MGLFDRRRKRGPATGGTPDAADPAPGRASTAGEEPAAIVPPPPPAAGITAAPCGDEPATVADGDRLLGEGDVDGAQAAYERAEAGGEVRAALKLAALMEDHRKDVAAAEAAWRRADDAGDVNGAGNLGRLLKERGDVRGAEAAFRRCCERGSLRAAIDYAGLVSLRPDATHAEIADAVAALCPAIDGDLNGDRMLMAASFVFEGIEERCDEAAIEAGLRIADERGSASGAYHLGFVLWNRKGRRADAAAAYHRSAQRGYAEAWAKSAGGYLEIGDVARAEATAREGDEAGVGVASTMLGMILDQQGDTDGGLEAYRRADDRGDATGAFNLGIELSNRGDQAGAVAALTRAEERGSEDAAGVRSAVIRKHGLPELDAAARRDGESLWAWGVRLEQADDEAGAMMAFAQAFAADDPPDSQRAAIIQADTLERLGDTRAEAAYARLVEADDSAIRASALGGLANHRLRRGEADEAVALLRTVVEIGDRDETPRALRNIGAILDERGDRGGAREAYFAAIELKHPHHSPGAMVNVAQTLDAEGDHAGAGQMFRDAIETGHEVEAPRARVLLGVMLEEQGNTIEALEWWESAIGSPDEEWSQRAATNAGGVYLAREDFDKAAELFRIGSRIESPGEAGTILYLLGACEMRRGDRAAAVEALTQAAALTDGEVHAEVVRMLGALRRG